MKGTDQRLTRSRRDRCIIFLHIPKTGGTTLRQALKWKYPSEVLYEETLSKPLKALEQVPLSERANARVVSGHLHYGVHEYIPRQCDYVTVLREPVARVVSSYHFILGDPKHWLHADLMRSDAPWEEFLRTEPTVDNHQTRMISGRGGGELTRAPEPLDCDALEKAKRNLERFLVVGLTERFDETFLLLGRALRWKLPFYLTANVTRHPKRASESIVERVRERNDLDLELYEFADKLLSATIAEQGASFRPELVAFKALNKVPTLVYPHLSGRGRRIVQAVLPR